MPRAADVEPNVNKSVQHLPDLTSSVRLAQGVAGPIVTAHDLRRVRDAGREWLTQHPSFGRKEVWLDDHLPGPLVV